MNLLLLLFTLYYSVASKETAVVCVSEEELKLYEMLNEYRKENGLTEIPFSARLTQVAQAHVRDLESHYDFSPDNKCNPHSWSQEGNWTSCCYTNDHREAKCMWNKPKEIAGYNDPGFEIAFYASNGARSNEALQGWIDSPSHQPLLVNSGQWSRVTWKAAGIGIYGNYAVIWFGEAPDASEWQPCN